VCAVRAGQSTFAQAVGHAVNSLYVSAVALGAGALTQAYVADGCRTLTDFKLWAADGHLMGFVIANLVAPVWRFSAVYKNAQAAKGP
jgi:hypothetical protein